MNPEPFDRVISSRLAALSALIAALDTLRQHAPAWRSARASHACHELRLLLGRLRDTDEQDWTRGSAASWLSPLDVDALRSGLLTALYRADASAAPLTPSLADDLEALADALDMYLESAERRR